MNEIGFVIAPCDFPTGGPAALEPFIDGVSLVDRYAQVDGEHAIRLDPA